MVSFKTATSGTIPAPEDLRRNVGGFESWYREQFLCLISQHLELDEDGIVLVADTLSYRVCLF